MKIGQRFDVFEVTAHVYGQEIINMPIGFQAIGEPSPHGITGITMPAATMYGKFTMWPEEIKKVGTLVITKLK